MTTVRKTIAKKGPSSPAKKLVVPRATARELIRKIRPTKHEREMLQLVITPRTKVG